MTGVLCGEQKALLLGKRLFVRRRRVDRFGVAREKLIFRVSVWTESALQRNYSQQ